MKEKTIVKIRAKLDFDQPYISHLIYEKNKKADLFEGLSKGALACPGVRAPYFQFVILGLCGQKSCLKNKKNDYFCQ